MTEISQIPEINKVSKFATGAASSSSLTRPSNNNTVSTIPDIADINITSTLSRLQDSTTYFAVVPSSGDPEAVISRAEVEAAIEYRNSFKSGSLLAKYAEFFRKIESLYFAGLSKTGMFGGGFSNDSIFYWVKKFFAFVELSKHVNSTTNQKRGSYEGSTFNAIHAKFVLEKYSANTSSFFRSFSDSIGLLANSKYHQLDSTQPIFDITQESYGVPIPFTANMESKIGPTARNLMYNLSKGTTAQMRRNLLNLAYYNAAITDNYKVSSRVAHACNLVNDVAFFVAFNKQTEARSKEVESKFSAFNGALFRFIQYISNIGNKCSLNLRDIYAPINGYDKDFVNAPGSTDLVVSNLSEAAINNQIRELNDFAIADAVMYRNLYSNTVQNDGDFLEDQLSLSGKFDVTKPDTNILLPSKSTSINVERPSISNPNNIGSTVNRKVFHYGSPDTDLTTYFDLAPELRGPYTQVWLDRGYTLSKLAAEERKLQSRGVKTGTLTSILYTTQGSSGRMLTGNYSVAVPSNQKHLLGTTLRITDAKTGEPIGGNLGNPQGIFRVDDTGSSKTLVGGLDFYYDTPELRRYFNTIAGREIVVETIDGDRLVFNDKKDDIIPLVDRPEVDVKTATAGAPTDQVSPSLEPPEAPQGTKITSGDREVSVNEQNEAVNNAANASARPYSNKQRMFPFSFKIRGEDIDGDEVYTDVDFLLKKVVVDNFNVYKRIDTLMAEYRDEGSSGSSGDKTQSGKNPRDYIKLLNSNNITSKENITQILEQAKIKDPDIAKYVSAIYSQNKITNETLSNTLNTFLTLNADRIPANLLSQISSNRALYDNFVGQLNSIGQGAGLPMSSDIMNVFNPLSYIDINVEGVIPDVSLGSLSDMVGIISEIGTSGPPTSIGGAYALAKRLKDIVCNFQLPSVSWPLIKSILKIKFKPQDIGKAIKEEFKKITDRLSALFDPTKIYKSIEVNVTKFFKSIYKDLFVCNEKKKSNKTGKQSNH